MEFQHYFVEKPEEKNVTLIKEVIRGHLFKFYTSSNIFSRERVDPGSKLLADTMVVFEGSKVLDLGCGCGILGIVAKKICPEAEVWLSDVNELAIKYSKLNAELNNVDVKVVKSNVFENINELFDIIVTNPPYTAGKEVIQSFIQQSYEHLNSKGVFQLVATKKFRYVEALLKKYFDGFELFRKQGNYLIYFAYKK